jgi:hypothetical protein
MIERGGGTRFAEKALQRRRVFMGIFRKELQRDAPAELGVLGFVDDTHPPATQFAEDVVMANSFVIHRSLFEREW